MQHFVVRFLVLPDLETHTADNFVLVKVGFKKVLDGYRARSGEFRFVDIPPMRYLVVDGYDDPNTALEYVDGLAALYPVAYALKFASKNLLERDYVVPPLEGLWWANDMRVSTTARQKSLWEWTMMLLVLEWIDVAMVTDAINKVGSKNPPAALDRVRPATLEEGTCVQTLHIGSYDDEGPVLAALHEDFIPAHGYEMTGKHHEIYLSDPRRVEPARLRTILRQPVVRRS